MAAEITRHPPNKYLIRTPLEYFNKLKTIQLFPQSSKKMKEIELFGGVFWLGKKKCSYQ
jgi:hypothetical protein